MPFEYVPSGRRYSAPDYQGHREGGEGLFRRSDPWLPLVLHQRHLLQVGLVDRFVGRLLDRLKAQGIYDEALIIITADHGVSFQHGLPRRTSTDGTRGAVMLVPLIIKLPNQVAGFISDRNVETVDIVPTIASVLSTRVPYDVDGRSLLAAQTERTEKVFVQRNRIRVIVESRRGVTSAGGSVSRTAGRTSGSRSWMRNRMCRRNPSSASVAFRMSWVTHGPSGSALMPAI